MDTAPVALLLVGIVALVATGVACVATLKAHAASVALRSARCHHSQSSGPARPQAGDEWPADGDARELCTLVETIGEHADRLTAILGPSSEGIEEVLSIRRAAEKAAHITGAVRIRHDLDTPATTLPELIAPTGPSVLVVEDEPGMRELISTVLRRVGHRVVAVDGPHAALKALNGQVAIALMLVDVVMPVMDGYELATEARRISPGLHVIFISAFARDPDRHPPGDGFLAKPFASDALTDIVTKALSGPAGHR